MVVWSKDRERRKVKTKWLKGKDRKTVGQRLRD